MSNLEKILTIAKSVVITLLIAVLGFGGMYLTDKKLNALMQLPEPEESKPSSGVVAEPKIELSGLNTAEIGGTLTIGEMVLSVTDGNLINGSEMVDTSKLGDAIAVISVARSDGSTVTFNTPYTVKDTTAPVITVTSAPSIRKGKSMDLLSCITVADNSNEQINVTVSGDYSFEVEGEYPITYTCSDSSGNTASAQTVLSVYVPPIAYSDTALRTPDSITTATYKLPYAITVYREYGTVVVYAPDESGLFTVPVRSIIASPGNGNNTPLGTYYTPQKYEWRMLVGEVYGQYSTRITGQILFHSVPYKQRDKTTLKYWLYNKLGEKDSLGCIRLPVEDCKWIYDNCPLGTAVTITTDPVPTGIVRPDITMIPEDSPNKGWDPTDPDPANPWKASQPETPPAPEQSTETPSE